jgi:hypothetical protein
MIVKENEKLRNTIFAKIMWFDLQFILVIFVLNMHNSFLFSLFIIYNVKWVGEFCLEPNYLFFCQLDHDESKCHVLSIDDIRFGLDKYAQFDFYSSTFVAYCNNSPRIELFLHSDTLSWFQSRQSIFVILNVVCLTKKQHISFL